MKLLCYGGKVRESIGFPGAGVAFGILFPQMDVHLDKPGT